MVDTERIDGELEKIQGKVEQAVGKATGSKKTQARGIVHETEGNIKTKIAGVKRKVRGL